ncbi:MAG: DsbA family protein [Bacteriovoracaceae bacterium]
MKDKLYIYIGSLALLVSFFIIGSHFYKKSQGEQFEQVVDANKNVFVREHSPRFGDPKAEVIITEFLDPECESCRAAYPGVKELLKEYEGKVQLVVRFAPFHANSKHAIKVLNATRKQNKFWESLEHLFYYQKVWADHHNPKPEMVYKLLPKVGVDIEKLKEDMKDPSLDKLIEQDLEDLRMLNVKATPTFFVNGKPLEDYGLKFLQDLVKAEVSRIYN